MNTEENSGKKKRIPEQERLFCSPHRFFLCLFYKKIKEICIFRQKNSVHNNWEHDLHYIRAKAIKSQRNSFINNGGPYKPGRFYRHFNEWKYFQIYGLGRGGGEVNSERKMKMKEVFKVVTR